MSERTREAGGDRRRGAADDGRTAIEKALLVAADGPRGVPLQPMFERRMLALQATYGNGYVQRLLRTANTQATGVGPPNGAASCSSHVGC